MRRGRGRDEVDSSAAPRPLDGVRVLELGSLLAGPFAGALLAGFGAEVIKIEPPEGDPIRGWRLLDADGTSLWWRSLARGKKSVVLDLRSARGRELARRLALASDVLVENFRPGTLERWGLAPERLWEGNPGLVVVRVSGFGQTGPKAHRPGYASVCEAEGGLRYLTGHPGAVPVRANLSLGDSLAGLHAAFGALLALRARDRDPRGRGQVVDVGIVDSVFHLLESTLPEFDRLGVVREPSGATITGIVPSNVYPCAEGERVVIGANSESNFRRLMVAMERADLAADAGLGSNAGRVARQGELDGAIAAWTAARPAAEVVAALDAAGVPCGRIQSIADLAADPHLAARGLIDQIEAAGRPLRVPAILPKLGATPAASGWAGPELGAHTREVLVELAGVAPEEAEALAAGARRAPR